MSLENIPLVLYPGDSWQLLYEEPAGATQPPKWTSSNPNVCRVSQAGVLMAHASGKTRITVNSISHTIYVGIHVTGMRITPTSHNMPPGAQFQLSAEVTPANATDQGVTWSCDSPCCTVSHLGTVAAISVGEAHITAQSDDQHFKSTATITVELPKSLMSFAVSSVKVHVGKTYEPQWSVAPVSPVSWSSSNPSVASVDSRSGLIKGLSMGQATIKATLESSVATIAVAVAPVPFRR